MASPIDLTTLAPFTGGEFRTRQDRARTSASERGFAGLMMWARGGSQHDSYADVHWLTGFYNQVPQMPDGPSWTANGHSAVVLSATGPVDLFANASIYDESVIAADSISAGGVEGDLIARVACALRDLPPGPVGMLGSQGLPFPWYSRIVEESGRTLVVVDSLGSDLRRIKSPAEQERLRAAGVLGSLTVDAIMHSAVPGVTEAEAVAAGVEVLVRNGGALFGMGLSSGSLAHTYGPTSPTPYDARRKLVRGDLFRIDLYGSVDGYCFDFGRTLAVGARPSAAQREIVDAARDSVKAGLQMVRPGATFAEIAKACSQSIAGSSWSARGRGVAPVMGDVWGHSLGNALEGPWIIDTNADLIEAGMCLALERRIVDTELGGATFEENFLVTEDGIEMLSTSDRWDD